MPRVPAPTVLILAAGEGTRMKSDLPKALHPLCGRPMIEWPIAAAREAGAGRVVVVDGPKRQLADALPDGVEVAIQEQPNGTGDAVRSAADHIGAGDTVLVLYGDVPLITAAAITALAEAHEASGAAATMATMELEDPRGYGRVVRSSDGSVERVVETKRPGDATPEEEAIREVNTGIYAFAGGDLVAALGSLTSDNAQGELYLPDVLPLLRAGGKAIAAHVVTDATLTLGVNTRVELATARRLAQERIHRAHALAGVTIVDPAATLIEAGVEIGRDTVVEPGTFLRGATRIGARCEVGPLTTLIDTTAGDDCRIVHSYLDGAELGGGVSVGPFAYLRPLAHLHDGAKAGTFVEIKNSEVGEGTKVPHLSYIGDADVGAGSNIGAGTITANYDGARKHRTTIGAGVRVSVHTSFVAPVRIGDGAYTGAGSVITDDVPADALGIARERQRNIEGYAERAPRKER
jgi:bifunctional UDP-N-acetylglucosamine pyrophosphorylase / glucosamine-1-phosphate N-acetyltransferase